MHTLLTIVVFLLILGVLVFVHELGHFAVAKWMGMKVDEFAIGFPPRLFSRRKGDTTYAINAIPFGGYVKIHGESPESQDDDPGSFEKKSVWARIAVVVAGVAMNILFAFVVLTIAFSIGFVSIGQDLQKVPGSTVKQNSVYIADVQADSGAAKAGVKSGDLIEAIIDATSGTRTTVTTVSDLVDYTKQAQEKGTPSIELVINRDGSEVTSTAAIAASGPPLGVYLQPYTTVRVPVWRAPVVAVKEMGLIIQVTWDALRNFGAQLFEKAKLDPNVSGPVGIYQATGQATKEGGTAVVFLVVALSLNLALLNILPIPALDGGKLFFLLIEAVARKRIVGRKAESIITFIGFSLLIGLIVVLSVRDLIRLF